MSDLREVFPNYDGIGNNQVIDNNIDNFYDIKKKIKDQIKNENEYSRSSNLSYLDKLYYHKDFSHMEKPYKEQFVSETGCQRIDEHIRQCDFCYRKFYYINPVERTNYFLSFIILVLIAILLLKKQ